MDDLKVRKYKMAKFTCSGSTCFQWRYEMLNLMREKKVKCEGLEIPNEDKIKSIEETNGYKCKCKCKKIFGN